MPIGKSSSKGGLSRKKPLSSGGKALARKTPLKANPEKGLSRGGGLRQVSEKRAKELAETDAVSGRPVLVRRVKSREELEAAAKKKAEREAARTKPKPSLKKKGSQRQVDEAHLDFIRTLPCLACGAECSEAHHLLRVPERGMGRKADDRHSVPLCQRHHRALHDDGNETGWLLSRGYEEPILLSEELYDNSGSRSACESIIEKFKRIADTSSDVS